MLRVVEKTGEVKELLSVKTKYEEVKKRANEIAESSRDYLVKNPKEMFVVEENLNGVRYYDLDGELHKSSISRFALSQLCTKIGVPFSYIDKCIKVGKPSLAEYNISSFLSDFKQDLFIRETDGRVRGILSKGYSIYDSHTILEDLEDTLDNNFVLRGSYISNERLHLRLVSRDMLPVEGEDLFSMLLIDSSDVGRKSLTVRYGVYKQVCTNGLMTSRGEEVLFNQRHFGIQPVVFREKLVANLNRIDKLASNMVERINKTKKIVWTKSLFEDEEFRGRFIEKTLIKPLNLSEKSADRVVNRMLDSYECSQWGLINSLTEEAQLFTLDRRIEIENLAGNLLEVA